MRKIFVSCMGAGVALAFSSMLSIAAPPGDAFADEVAYLVAEQTHDMWGGHIELVVFDHALVAEFIEAQMPDFSVSLIGDAGSETAPTTILSKEFGVSAAGTKSAAVWSIA